VPTETYLNLSPAKRQRFSDASINQIIKAAGISRGSFYQYFVDKEDLYLYMLTEIGKEKLAIAGQVEAPRGRLL
jgi:TetR/AcrR family transcriptional regulator